MPDYIPARRPSTGAEQLLSLLCGRWAITRQIKPGGHFEGASSFVPGLGTSLVYREGGLLTLDRGAVLKAECAYVYAVRGGVVAVSFGDGQGRGGHFIDIAVPEGWQGGRPASSADRHVCGPDTYEAAFCLKGWDCFTMTYVVRGPSKDYVSHSEFRRLCL